MMTIHDLSVRRLLRHFMNRGASGKFLKPFMDLPVEVQCLLSEAAILNVDEEPVIGCFFDTGCWTLLTTKRLVWADAGSLNSVLSSTLKEATVQQQHLMLAGNKQNIKHLTVVTEDRAAHVLRLEPGQPFFGFWNVMKLIVGFKRSGGSG